MRGRISSSTSYFPRAIPNRRSSLVHNSLRSILRNKHILMIDEIAPVSIDELIFYYISLAEVLLVVVRADSDSALQQHEWSQNNKCSNGSGYMRPQRETRESNSEPILTRFLRTPVNLNNIGENCFRLSFCSVNSTVFEVRCLLYILSIVVLSHPSMISFAASRNYHVRQLLCRSSVASVVSITLVPVHILLLIKRCSHSASDMFSGLHNLPQDNLDPYSTMWQVRG